MSKEQAGAKILDQLTPKQLGPECKAGLWTVSLPLPPDTDGGDSLDANPTYTKPIGKWHETGNTSPRRLLMISQATAGFAPETLKLTSGQPVAVQETPLADTPLIENSGEPLFLWECHAVLNPFLHKHNWLNGHILARLHANGVCCEFSPSPYLPVSNESAWRSGSHEEYSDALRQAYYFTDVCVDHAVKAGRMPGYPPNAFALPLSED